MSGWFRRDGSGPISFEQFAAERIEWGGRSAPVGRTSVGDVEVSTVFLGLDHSFGDGPPLIFETMVFGGEYDGEQERYSTEAQALAGHEAWVTRVGSES